MLRSKTARALPAGSGANASRGTPMRNPSSEARGSGRAAPSRRVVASRGSGPASSANSRPQSRAERAIGPTASIDGASGIAPWRLIRPRVGNSAVTPHIEWFGSEGAKPTVQAGLRGEVAKGWQLDGTVGRGDGETVYTLGVKRSF